MKNLISYMGTILRKMQTEKIVILFAFMIFFSVLYLLLDDKHFSGVNKYQEIVKEEVLKDTVQKEIKENFRGAPTRKVLTQQEIAKLQ